MLISQSFSVSAWPALPDWLFNAAKQRSSCCNHRIQGRLGNGWIATVAIQLVLVLFDVMRTSDFRSALAATSMISNMVTNA